MGDPKKVADGTETILAGQKKALELAVHGAPLRDVLAVIARTVEAQSTNGVLASILVLDDDGERLREGAAPSLAKDYNAAIDGIRIGPRVGSCGTAAHSRETVVVRDIATDPLWAEFKDLALAHDLRACWSTPIFSTRAEVLGTFALYHRVPTEPTARDREVVELLGHTAGVILERDRNARRRNAAEAEMRKQAQALKTFIDHLPSLAWTATPDGEVDYFNGRWFEYTGTTLEEARGAGWQNVYDAATLPVVMDRWTRSIASGEPFEMELTLRGADGISRWFLTRMVPMRDEHGKVLRWFGTSTDIDVVKRSAALAEAMVEQSKDMQRALLEMRAAKETAEERVRHLEAPRGGEGR